jgi:hypothetical protein
MPGGERVERIGLGGAIRGAVLRILVVTALALAGLLVFGLLPSGRDAPTVIPRPYPLPPVPTMHDLHPHGPNRLVTADRLVTRPAGMGGDQASGRNRPVHSDTARL